MKWRTRVPPPQPYKNGSTTSMNRRFEKRLDGKNEHHSRFFPDPADIGKRDNSTRRLFG